MRTLKIFNIIAIILVILFFSLCKKNRTVLSEKELKNKYINATEFSQKNRGYGVNYETVKDSFYSVEKTLLKNSCVRCPDGTEILFPGYFTSFEIAGTENNVCLVRAGVFEEDKTISFYFIIIDGKDVTTDIKPNYEGREIYINGVKKSGEYLILKYKDKSKSATGYGYYNLDNKHLLMVY